MTTKHAKMLAFIASCTDPTQLKTLIKNARARSEIELEKAAFKKLVSIVPSERPGTVEHDFWQAVHATEHMLTEQRGKTTRLARTRQKAQRVGIRQVLIDWAFVPVGQETEGFRLLLDWNMPELTGEAIVLRHPNSFDQSALEAARRRLEHAGVDVDTMLKLVRNKSFEH